MSRRLTARVGLTFTLAAALVTAFLIVAADSLSNHAAVGPDLRPLVLCAGLIGLSVPTYAAWPSRWNVVAHTNLVFAVVAYVIPIFALHRLALLGSAALDTYYRVIAIGFAACILGTLLGARLASSRLSERIRTSRDLEGHAGAVVARRTMTLTLVSAVMVLACFAYLRFIPALAADPLLAKFFKGSYGARYGAVSVPYRFGTSALALLLPLSAYFGLRRRASAWARITFAMATLVLVLGLLRQPALAGTLILLGAALAVRGRGLLLYFGVLGAAYVSGAGFYALLSAIGLGGFAASGAVVGEGFLTQVALGAPDLTDHITFLASWLGNPEQTSGRTFVGGLVPGNYFWNPSVWSLHVVNPGVPIDEISSGGLRLPAPIWGLVSFGWPGVVLVSFGNGLFGGFLARLFSRIVPSRSLLVATTWLVLYIALNNVIPAFYNLTYLAMIQLAVILWLILWRTRTPPAQPTERLSAGQDRAHAGHGVVPVRTPSVAAP